MRTALPLWEELVREAPSELDYQISLDATRSTLAFCAGAQGRFAEAREQLAPSSARWEALACGPLTASQRAILDPNRDWVRSVLSSIERAESMDELAVSVMRGRAFRHDTRSGPGGPGGLLPHGSY